MFTKADTDTIENIKKKIASARKSLQAVNKDIYDIIAYNSKDKVTVIGEGKLEKFLEMINNDSSCKDNSCTVLERYKNDLTEQLGSQISIYSDAIGKYENMMDNIGNIRHILSIVMDYQRKKIMRKRIMECKSKLSSFFDILISYAGDRCSNGK